MFSIRSRFTYSNVVATLALVFAMSGGAYAASKFLITSTKQIKPSVLASLKGKAGVNGAQGVAGAAGPAGPAGAVGPQGAPGAPGVAGELGPEGKEGKAGKNGTNGKEGSPWTANGTLPVGSTETGVWGFTAEHEEFLEEPISFTIPLAQALTEGHAHFINEKDMEEPVPGTEVDPSVAKACLGSAADPTAASGNLCVYTSHISNNTGIGSIGIFNPVSPPTGNEGASAGKTGAILDAVKQASGGMFARGTWAVTG